MKGNYGFSYFILRKISKTREMESLGVREHFLNPDFNYGKFALIRRQVKELVAGGIQDLLYAIADLEILRSRFVTSRCGYLNLMEMI